VVAEQKAAESIQGPTRRIFIEFLERSCTAEFSGFLLYKELGRRLKVRTTSTTHTPPRTCHAS
jgi:magnesium-protoporphyrin IX monomethyl ester (oxidative) cyclase